ncbi:hypothetical protein BG10_5501 [Bacillus thuringiensis serovar morrisoni]|uniref:Uncharacterized protein n=1 Tax=Bacillus cereus HuB4-4 TaxID=1053211 RepID=A0A9W5QW36_BACCE|nr:hypothetical protein IGM_02468 [Bacillus cereus HuB4-4]KIP28866.1 hypothetical protein BG10_5501 [Bacillus thuringiensis serovar morrisoni]
MTAFIFYKTILLYKFLGETQKIRLQKETDFSLYIGRLETVFKI